MHTGKGLGLTLCKKIVEWLGGTIEIESDENGTCVNFHVFPTNILIWKMDQLKEERKKISKMSSYIVDDDNISSKSAEIQRFKINETP